MRQPPEVAGRGRLGAKEDERVLGARQRTEMPGVQPGLLPEEYGKARDKGLSPLQSLPYAASQAAIE